MTRTAVGGAMELLVTVAAVRDWAIILFVAFWFIVLLALGILLFAIFRKVSSILDNVHRTTQSVQEAVQSVSDNVLKPIAQGGGLFGAFASIADMLRGLFARGDGREKVEVKAGGTRVDVRSEGGKTEARVEIQREKDKKDSKEKE